MPGKHLSPGTAHTRQDNAFCARIFCRLNKHRVIDRIQHGLKQVRLMPMNDNVHMILFQTSHIHFSPHRCGRPVENIRDLCGHHGATPTIGESRPCALLSDVLIVLVNAHVRPMHQFHDFPHGAPRDHALLAPGLQGLVRNSCDKGDFSLHLGIGALQFLVKVNGNIFDLPALHINAHIAGHLFQFKRVLDGIVLHLATDHFPENIQHAHPMVCVRGSPTHHHPGEVPRHNGINGGTANPHFCIRVFWV